MLRVPRLLGIALALTLTAGTSGCGNKAPTGPDSGSADLTAAAAIVVENVNSGETLGRVQLFWDGTLLDDESNTPPTSGFELGGALTTGAGSHTVSFKVTSQTSSPNTYTVSGTVIAHDLSSGASQEIDIAPQNISIATGTTHSFTVVLH